MVFFMSSATVGQFVVFGMLDLKYASFYGTVGIAGAIAGTKGAKVLFVHRAPMLASLRRFSLPLLRPFSARSPPVQPLLFTPSCSPPPRPPAPCPRVAPCPRANSPNWEASPAPAQALIDKTGRASFLIFFLAAVLFGSGILMGATGVPLILNTGFTGFRPLCGRAGAAARAD